MISQDYFFLPFFKSVVYLSVALATLKRVLTIMCSEIWQRCVAVKRITSNRYAGRDASGGGVCNADNAGRRIMSQVRAAEGARNNRYVRGSFGPRVIFFNSVIVLPKVLSSVMINYRKEIKPRESYRII